MKSLAVAALVGTMAVLAVAGLALATGSGAYSLGTQSRDGTPIGGGMGGMGGMGMHRSDYQYQGGADGCPMDHDYDYNWSYQHGGCHAEAQSGPQYQQGSVPCPMDNDWNYTWDYDHDYGGCPRMD